MNTQNKLETENHLENNDTFTSLEINIGTKKASDPPQYIHEYFYELERETKYAFRYMDCIVSDDSDPENQRIKIIYTLCVDVKPAKYQEYSDAIFETDILPFLMGCGFVVEAFWFTTVIPLDLMNLAPALRGTYDVVITCKKHCCYIDQLLKEIFGFTEQKDYDMVYESIEKAGRFGIIRCLNESDFANFDHIMKKFGLKYEIIR